MKTTMMMAMLAGVAGVASADLRITEWAYQADPGEYIELTNVGVSPIDMTGWSYDDDSRLPGVFDLSGFGIIAPGESVILTEATADAFRAEWNLSASVKIVGGYTNNLGRNDEINIFNAANDLIDRLTYGDQTFAGTIRTQGISGNALPADLGTNNVAAWFFSQPGDIFGSYFSATGSFGNPGFYIPAPGAVALIGMSGLIMGRRRR